MPKISTMFMILLLALLMVSNELNAQQKTRWQEIIRATPYYSSIGFTNNLMDIRRWVLLSNGYCEVAQRHIVFDRRGAFLGWMSNPEDPEDRQQKLNELRERLYNEKAVADWLPGAEQLSGYPFALSCDQPDVDLDAAIERLLVRDVWGTWDGLVAGSEDKPVSLIDTAQLVWNHRQLQLKEPLDAIDFSLFLAQLIIESGAKKRALSRVNAIGILQLRESVLKDCNIPERHWRHRMAQVDCSVRLYVLNRRNIEPLFTQAFGHLPEQKRNRLFSILLMQTYHSGIGNMKRLLTDTDQGRATAYFALHHEKFTAEDIATGMIFHNLGRAPWGWESLYYLIDIEIAEQTLCQRITC